MIITIDGPAGAGKSTVARKLATALGLPYIDTGAMYRAVALKALRGGLSLEDAEALASLARSLDLRFDPLTPDGLQRVWLEGEDVTQAIRTPEVSEATSILSTLSPVRRELVARQRQMALQAREGAVLEGRDTGTVVVPEAGLKVFLSASLEERIKRRAAELRAKGIPFSEREIQKELAERDARDSQRADSPLRPAPDAVLLSTDGLTPEEVVQRILKLYSERAHHQIAGGAA